MGRQFNKLCIESINSINIDTPMASISNNNNDITLLSIITNKLLVIFFFVNMLSTFSYMFFEPTQVKIL